MNESPDAKEYSIQQAIAFMKANRPLRTEELCRDYLTQHPGCTDHMRMLGHALMKQKRLPEAEEQLRFALSLDPDFPQLHEDLGSVLAMQSRFEEAIPELEQAVKLQPALALAHKKLGQALANVGRGEDADESFERYFDSSPNRAALARGLEHLNAERIDEAIETFQAVLKESPEDVNALRFLAAAYRRDDRNLEDAEALLRRATQLAPHFVDVWIGLGSLLHGEARYVDSIEAYRKAVELEPENASAWGGLGNANASAMYPEKSVECYAKSLELAPDMPFVLMGQAHVLKTLGDQTGALKSYRGAVKARPNFGEVYWSMANLKVFKFEEAEVASMMQQLERDDLTESEAIHFRFALGKAFEDQKDYDQAWHYYHTGNQLQRMTVQHEGLEMEGRFTSIKSVYNQEFIQMHADHGCDAPDPILIVGLPRSGSTLVEQILASHSQVEGTSELPVLGKLASSIGRYRTDGIRYPDAVKDLRNRDWHAYGQEYLEECKRHRLTDRPYFTDKLPNNFSHIGLLHLILPNAKVINARRHPYDSCLGSYKQLFAGGQNFTYDMQDLAHYYEQYDTMMKHWHTVLPGKVLDVHYEETVNDLESQVRNILDHCGLPFEQSCVEFYKSDRAVKTASSEQVRQPIYFGAMGTWRHYEKHIDLWQEQLGRIIDDLPEVSRNAGL